MQRSLEDVSTQVIGPSWGEQITQKALTGLVVFLVLIVFYLSITFEWRMAIAALVALFHDVFITVGIYSLSGFEVTPATVIGVLTISGLLPVRHSGRLRQGQGEHPRSSSRRVA